MKIEKPITYNVWKYPEVNFDAIFLPLARRVMPNLVANDLVQVQPINLPVGMLMHLNYVEVEEYTSLINRIKKPISYNVWRILHNNYGILTLNGLYNSQYVYTPYIPLQTTPITIESANRIGISSRYATKKVNNSYYTSIDIGNR
jgi:hypothetical protein